MVNVVDPTSGEVLTKSVRPRNSSRTIASRNLLREKSKQATPDGKNKVKRADNKLSDADLTASKPTDVISDDKLRAKLSQSGFPNIPITNTTKDILIRKLKKAPRFDSNPQNSVNTYSHGTNNKTKTDEVASMTDLQLRSALLKYGCQNIPVTDTTRCLLKNKLKVFMNSIYINHISVVISNTFCDSTDTGTLNRVKSSRKDSTEASRRSTRCQRPGTQSDKHDNSMSKKSKRKRLQAMDAGCQSTNTEFVESDVKIITMQHRTLYRHTRVQRGLWDTELKSFYNTASNGISDYEEPFEEIIHSLLGNSYRLSGFRSYW